MAKGRRKDKTIKPGQMGKRIVMEILRTERNFSSMSPTMMRPRAEPMPIKEIVSEAALEDFCCLFLFLFFSSSSLLSEMNDAASSEA